MRICRSKTSLIFFKLPGRWGANPGFKLFSHSNSLPLSHSGSPPQKKVCFVKWAPDDRVNDEGRADGRVADPARVLTLSAGTPGQH
jgi:hypothetical protein